MAIVDFVVQIGQTVGWDTVAFGFAIYQLYCPESVHPKNGTKFQRLLKRTDPAVKASLEAIAEETPNVDAEAIRKLFNGGDIRPEDVKEDSSKVKQ